MNAFWSTGTEWFPAIAAAQDMPGVMDVVLVLSLICLAIGGVGLFIHRLTGPSCRTLVKDWCQERQWRVVRMRRCYLWKGPFFFTSHVSAVYYVTVHDAFGYPKHLWARCGHGLFGMLVPNLQVVLAD